MRCLLSGLAAAAVLAAWPARANDRPYQVARTAVMEDEDGVWSIEAWGQRRGSVRGLAVEGEYVFDPANSVQVELGRELDRLGVDTGHEAEIELKHIFNDIARDGWAWALGASWGIERFRHGETEDDDAEAAPGHRTVRSWSLKLPVSVSLFGGAAFAHLNVGLDKASDERRSFARSIGLEGEVVPKTTLFAELAQSGGEKYGQLGVRHWIKREKLAFDAALQQQRADGQRASGFIVGIGWYDL